MSFEEQREFEIFAQQFRSITQNLWYTWDNDAQGITQILLERDNRDLSSYQRFHDFPEERKMDLFRNPRVRATVDHVYRKMQDYLSAYTWFDKHLETNPEHSVLTQHPISYFCAEYGFTDWLPIYSGGLGVLAADILKESSDLGIPMVGIGLLYHYGYFTQIISEDGMQNEHYELLDPTKLPLTQIRISTGAPLLIEVTMKDHPVYCRIWQVQVGRIPLFLLDTNIDRNPRDEDRMITGHLYGGDPEMRMRQEIVLGIGGERALTALGYRPSIFAMNEGHSAFASIEITRHFMQDRGMTFLDAREHTKHKITYTNHTLVTAGNDAFEYDLTEKYLSPYTVNLGIDFKTLFKFGEDSTHLGKFSMPSLAFSMSFKSNAVSVAHGHHARNIWPDQEMIPITNGVHMPTWVHPRMERFYEKYVSEEWRESDDDAIWENILHAPDEELWTTHLQVKEELIDYVKEFYDLQLNKDAMIVTWSRRFAAYKRVDMLLFDLHRLYNILAHHERPVQIIYAGKAHPHDTESKGKLAYIQQLAKTEGFSDKFVFVPDYSVGLARYLVSGSDVWLNTPIEELEASGTSGMKAGANGLLQCTTNSGWIEEVDLKDKGFMIEGPSYSESLYYLFESVIAPSYFDRNEAGVPLNWTKKMKHTIRTICSEYATKRTLKDYFNRMFVPSLEAQGEQIL